MGLDQWLLAFRPVVFLEPAGIYGGLGCVQVDEWSCARGEGGRSKELRAWRQREPRPDRGACFCFGVSLSSQCDLFGDSSGLAGM